MKTIPIIIIIAISLLYLSGLNAENRIPVNKEYYYQMKDKIEKGKNWQEGETIFKAATREYPDEMQFHVFLNVFLQRQKKYDEALSLIEKIYKTHKNNSDIRYCYIDSLRNYGWKLYLKGKKNEGFGLYQKAFELAPDDEWNCYHYGSMLRLTNRFEESFTLLGQGISRFPGNREIKTELDQCYNDAGLHQIKNGNLKKAGDYARKSAENSDIRKALSRRKITLNCQFNFKKMMNSYLKQTRPSRCYISMPRTTYYQKFISLTSGNNFIDIIKKENGDNFAVFDFTRGFPERLLMTIVLENKLENGTPVKLKAFTDKVDDAGAFAFEKSAYYDTDNPELINGVKKITAEANTLPDKVKAIHSWISKNIIYFSEHPKYKNRYKEIYYKPELWPHYKSITEIYKEKTGHCGHYAEIFTGMVRILKIPARVISGITVEVELLPGATGGHIVSEIYDADNKRWIYMESGSNSIFGNTQPWHIIFSNDPGICRKEDCYVDFLDLRRFEEYSTDNHYSIKYTIEREFK